MPGLIISLLWVVLYLAILVGVFLAVLWLLRYIGLPIPPQVEKFGLVVIALLALIWIVTIVFGVGGSHPLLR